MRKPKITKTASGKWNAKIYIGTDPDGKRVYKSITAPLKAEVERQLREIMEKKDALDLASYRKTVGDILDEYIALVEPTLSPSTVAGYRKTRRVAFGDLMGMHVDELTDTVIQAEINKEVKRPHEKTGNQLSAKTIKNEWGAISSALRTMCNMSFRVRLPKVQRTNRTLPEPGAVIEAITGTSIEVPCLLAIWLSMSMSEIRGLRASSVHDGVITIDQVCIDVGNMPVIKGTAKTSTRIRKQALPRYIADLIEDIDAMKIYRQTGKDGLLFPAHSSAAIRNRFRRIMDAAGLDITFHDLRHIFASVMLTKLQVPERIVQDEGGWSTGHVMKTVYSNSFDSSRLEADAARDAYYGSLLESIEKSKKENTGEAQG